MLTKEQYPIAKITAGISNRNKDRLVFKDHTTNKSYLEVWRPVAHPVDVRTIATPYVIPQRFAFRADLIANTLYGSPSFAWAVCYFNNILDPFDPITGLVAQRILYVVPTTYFNQVTNSAF